MYCINVRLSAPCRFLPYSFRSSSSLISLVIPLRFRTPISFRSFSRSLYPPPSSSSISTHVYSLFCFATISNEKFFFTILFSCIRPTRLVHPIRRDYFTTSAGRPIILSSSRVLRIFQVPSKFYIGSFIFFNTFRSNIRSWSS